MCARGKLGYKGANKVCAQVLRSLVLSLRAVAGFLGFLLVAGREKLPGMAARAGTLNLGLCPRVGQKVAACCRADRGIISSLLVTARWLT